MTKDRALLLAEIHEYLLEFEAQGLVERTGEFRDGEPVWIATARGRALAQERHLKVAERVH